MQDGEDGVTPGVVTATALFSEEGVYTIRVHATDAESVESAGHAQCCWTNAYFRVTIGG